MASRKDYEAAAGILAQARGDMQLPAHERLVSRFADMFERDNPRFDRQRFIEACVGKRAK